MNIILSILLAVPAAAQVKNPDTFVYAIVGDVDSLDPHWQYDGISHFIGDQVYEGLVGFDGPSVEKFEPRLATQVPSRQNGLLSPDGRTYTFPIRKGVVFHDGTTMTAEDARYSILRDMLMDRAGGHAWLLLDAILGVQSTRGADNKPIPGIYARAAAAVRVEGGSLKITLHRPFAPFLSILASFGDVVSQRFSAANDGWDGSEASWLKFNDLAKEASPLFMKDAGTGPFRVERWDRQAQQVTLARNEHYWRKPAALRHVVIRTVNEYSTRKLLLQSGDADCIFADRSYLPQLEALPGVAVVDGLPFLEVHNSFLFGLKLNVNGNPNTGSGKLDGRGIPGDFFADVDVRQGFAKAFPYDKYIADVYRGKGTRAIGPIPRGLLGYDPKAPLVPEDLKAAEAHLKKAFGGKVWENGFVLTCAYQEGKATRGQACTILKSVLEAMNPKFRIDVRALQWSTFLDAQDQRKLPLVNARWSLDYPDPHNAVSPYLQSEGTYAKVQGYANPKADKLIEEAAAATDDSVRRKLYRQLLDLAREDVPSFFTLDTYDFRVTRSWVKGFGHNSMKPYGVLYGVTKEGN